VGTSWKGGEKKDESSWKGKKTSIGRLTICHQLRIAHKKRSKLMEGKRQGDQYAQLCFKEEKER